MYSVTHLTSRTTTKSTSPSSSTPTHVPPHSSIAFFTFAHRASPSARNRRPAKITFAASDTPDSFVCASASASSRASAMADVDAMGMSDEIPPWAMTLPTERCRKDDVRDMVALRWNGKRTPPTGVDASFGAGRKEDRERWNVESALGRRSPSSGSRSFSVPRRASRLGPATREGDPARRCATAAAFAASGFCDLDGLRMSLPPCTSNPRGLRMLSQRCRVIAGTRFPEAISSSSWGAGAFGRAAEV